MSPLVPAVGGALIVAGTLGLIAALRPSPVPLTRPARTRALAERLQQVPRRTLALTAAGLMAVLVLPFGTFVGDAARVLTGGT